MKTNSVDASFSCLPDLEIDSNKKRTVAMCVRQKTRRTKKRRVRPDETGERSVGHALMPKP